MSNHFIDFQTGVAFIVKKFDFPFDKVKVNEFAFNSLSRPACLIITKDNKTLTILSHNDGNRQSLDAIVEENGASRIVPEV